MNKTWRKAWLRALSGLTINLSAGWFGIVLILPNFSQLKNFADVVVLIYNLASGTIFLLVSVWLERKQRL